jgi:hypothetical protein
MMLEEKSTLMSPQWRDRWIKIVLHREHTSVARSVLQTLSSKVVTEDLSAQCCRLRILRRNKQDA